MQRMLAVGAFLLYAGVILYPFRWSPPRWVENGAKKTALGWQFPAPGLVHAQADFPDPMRIVLRVKPARTDQHGPARIFTISRDNSLRNVTLAQDDTDLILRLRSAVSSRNGQPQVHIPGVFQDTEWKRIELILAGREVSVLVEGRRVHHRVYGSPPRDTWEDDFKMALGNELTGGRPWLGEIDYAGELTRPDRYWEMQHSPRLMPFRVLHGRDLLLNFFGFVPLGILLAWIGWTSASVYFTTTGLSVLIEIIQLGMANRFSSTTDVLLNGLGALAGALVMCRVRPPGPEPGPTGPAPPS